MKILNSLYLRTVSIGCFVVFLTMPYLKAQDNWTLDRCIEYAIEHSLDIKETSLNANAALIDQNVAKLGRLPNLSGASNYGLSFGRRIDPTTNDFINQRFGNQGFSLSSGVTLFNGGFISNRIKTANLGKQVADLDVEQMKNDIALGVAQAFIRVLFAEENLANTQKSLDLIGSQLDQIDKLIDAGSRPKNARLDLVAQLAQNEQLVIAAQNDIDIAYLDLKQLMQLNDAEDMKVVAPQLDLPTDYDIESASTQKIYSEALAWQPGIKAGELRKKTAEVGVALSRSNLIPSLGIGGSLNTNWSSSARQSTIIGTKTNSQNFLINGEPVEVQFEEPNLQFSKINYPDQLSENLGYGFGLQLNVPIFNQGINKGNLDRAKLDVVRSDIVNEQIKNQLKTDVQRAVADAKAAKKQYEASLRTAEARRTAYEDTEKRFSLGVANSFEFITAQNNMDQAEVDLSIAKYDYIFKAKVLDFYLGKKITLN